MTEHRGEAELAASFRALSDPTRLRLLSLIASHEDERASVVDLTALVELSQPTISHHLKILLDAELITRTKHGSWSYYMLVPGALGRLGRFLTAADTAWSQAPANDEA